MFKDTKERLSKRTGFKGKQLEKIKFAVVQRSSYSKPVYLNDGRVPLALLQTYRAMMLTAYTDDVLSEIAGGDDMLGLDHVNKTRSYWNRGDSIFIR